MLDLLTGLSENHNREIASLLKYDVKIGPEEIQKIAVLMSLNQTSKRN